MVFDPEVRVTALLHDVVPDASDQDPLFSKHFWTAVANGLPVGSAFEIATTAVAALSDSQRPLLDDGGGVGTNDGRGNGARDGLLSRGYGLGPGVLQAGNGPLIGDASDDLLIEGTSATDVDAMDVSSTGSIQRVFGGGPVGIEAIAHTMSTATDTLEDDVEPFLLRCELVIRTPRGRKITPKGEEHLGVAPQPAPQGKLF